MNEIVTATQRSDVALHPEVSAPMAERLLELASREGVNEAIMDKLISWQEREAARQAEERFNDSMAAVQREIEPVARTAQNSQTKSMYAKLEDITKAISPIYLRHGFSVRYNTVPPLQDGNIRVECAVSLGRHTERFHREAGPDVAGPQGKAVKTALHGGGSTETYLKRYALCGAFNVTLVGLDDDGHRGGTKFISEPQAEELRALMHEVGRQEGPFLDRLFAGAVRSVDEIEEGPGYLAAKSTLEGIKAQQRAKNQEAK